mmetsp:Transcript_22527/g.62875  ORF Transcript_22527/g.62875 Transcript_22527/m.62875 type:complete len:84 (+) Transcript_22527:1580-1831(+)
MSLPQRSSSSSLLERIQQAQQREQQQQKQDEQMEKERAEFHARSVGHGYRISTAAQMIPKVFPNVIALSKDDRFWSPVLNVKQ